MDEVPTAFLDRLAEIVGSRERAQALLEVEDRRSVRVNRLKTTPREIQRRLGALGIELTPVPWSADAFFVDDPVDERSLGHVFEHQAGHVFIQSPVSALPVDALDPQPGERVLDLAAAPGSKTTHIAERMEGWGLLVANDRSAGRVHHLISNLDQTGAPNAVVTQADACRLAWPITFDRVLVDAPCSTLGSMHKDWAPVHRYEDERIHRLAGTQRALLTSAFHAVREGGHIVYATCTFEPLENQAVVEWFLETYPVEIEPFRPKLGEPAPTDVAGKRYDEAVGDALLVLADETKSESFFVARFTKQANAAFPDARQGPWHGSDVAAGPPSAVEELVEHYALEDPLLNGMQAVQTPSRWYGTTVPDVDEALELAPERVGVYVAKPEPKGPRLSFEAATLVGQDAGHTIELEPDQARTWLAGGEVELGMGHDVPDAWAVVTCRGEPLGCGRPFGTRLPSYVPKRNRVPSEGDLVGFLAADGG